MQLSVRLSGKPQTLELCIYKKYLDEDSIGAEGCSCLSQAEWRKL